MPRLSPDLLNRDNIPDRSSRERSNLAPPALPPISLSPSVTASNPSSHTSSPSLDAKKEKTSFFSNLLGRGSSARASASESSSSQGGRKFPTQSTLGLEHISSFSDIGAVSPLALVGQDFSSGNKSTENVNRQGVLRIPTAYTQKDLDMRMAEVSERAFTGKSFSEKIDCVKELEDCVIGLVQQGKIQRGMSDMDDVDGLSPLSPLGEERGGNDLPERKSSGLVPVIIPRGDLVNTSLFLCRLDHPLNKQRIRLAGFSLLNTILSLPAIDASPPTLPLSNLLEIMNTTCRISGNGLTKSTSSFSLTEEIASRLPIILKLTQDGSDIALGISCGLVKVLVDWTRNVGEEWAEWCAIGGDLAVEGGKGNLGENGMATGSTLTAILSPPPSTKMDLPLLDGKDSGRNPNIQPEVTDPNITTLVLNSLSRLLLSIIEHNLPLFSPRDVATILDLHIGILEAGIKACEEGRAARENVSAAAAINSRSRSLSLSKSSRSKSRGPEIRSQGGTDTRSSSQTSNNLSRGPSLRRKAEGGFSVVAATVPLPQVSKDTATEMQLPPRPRWTTLLPSFIHAIRIILSSRVVPPISVKPLVRLICFAAGTCPEAVLNNDEHDLGMLARDLICDGMIGRTSERGLKGMLEEAGSQGAEKDVVVYGAIQTVRAILQLCHTATLSEARQTSSSNPFTFSFHSLAESLVKTLGQHREHRICSSILDLINDHLDTLEGIGSPNLAPDESRADVGSSLDAWSEGDVICQLLGAFVGPSANGRGDTFLLGSTGGDGEGVTAALIAQYYDIIKRLPATLGSLQSTSSNPVFWHPDFVDLLMTVSNRLSPEFCLQLIEHFRQEGLCLPGADDWLGNAAKVMRSFYDISTEAARPDWAITVDGELRVRVAAASLIYKDVYETIKDFASSRTEIILEVILPVLEDTLATEGNGEIEAMVCEVLTSAAVRETLEQDEAKRQAEAFGVIDLDASMVLKVDQDADGSGKVFDLVRKLLLRTARTAKSETASSDPARALSPSGDSEDTMSISFVTSPIVRSRENSNNMSSRPAIFDNLHRSSDVRTASEGATRMTSLPTEALGRGLAHDRCKALCATNSLIAIFTRLAFSMPHALITSDAKHARLPASASCSTLFDDLLRLLAPNPALPPVPRGVARPDQGIRPESTQAACSQARLSILQWLMRLRANTQHRIWVKHALDDAALASATILARLRDAPDFEAVALQDDGPSRRKGLRMDAVASERGRESRAVPEAGAGRSRSRSRQPLQKDLRPPAPTPSKPIWYIPDDLTFEIPADSRPSEGMTTYDPLNQSSAAVGTATKRSGVWLPISRYIEVIMAILVDEPDWELVSYALVFLPLQLANKHFFCGPNSAKLLKALRQLLCDGIINDRIGSKVTLPLSVKRTQVKAVAYQSLTLLISYKKEFSKSDVGQMLDAFARGLSGHKVTAKPCIQALTLAAYELPDALVTHVPTILPSLLNVMTSPDLSVHILEFLYAVGQVPALYTNFTEAQYQSVFKIATSYIQIHNGVQAKDEAPAEDEDFTLSQHVIGLSYFCIYLWFIALGLGRRPRYVSYLARNILAAFPDNKFDEMAEVCFDWLSRYTYGNADPKPAVDPIEPIVFGDAAATKAKHWLLGNGIVSVQTQPQSGWTKITMRRASGTVSMLAKVQNVAVVGLGEENADLYLEPAILQRDRDAAAADSPPVSAPIMIGADAVGRPPTVAPDSGLLPHSQSLLLSSSPTARFNMASMETPMDNNLSFIWAGSAPSQRRKIVAIDPAFIGLQLSAYPYISLDQPRGRLLNSDESTERAIRLMDNMPVIDTHRVAVLYVGPGQTNEIDILGNRDGSPAFLRFLAELGRLIKLKGQKDIFTGGLDTQADLDGEYAYAWWDDLTQVVYHAPHLMPNEFVNPGDQVTHTRKKAHVGNDAVRVIFNDSGGEYAFDTLNTQFNFINIVISAHTSGVSGAYNDSAEHDFFKVTLQRKKGIPEYSSVGDFKLVSAAALPTFIRQLTLLSDHICEVYKHTSTEGRIEFVTSWRNRHRSIGRLRSRLDPVADTANMSELEKMEAIRDFTKGF